MTLTTLSEAQKQDVSLSGPGSSRRGHDVATRSWLDISRGIVGPPEHGVSSCLSFQTLVLLVSCVSVAVLVPAASLSLSLSLGLGAKSIMPGVCLFVWTGGQSWYLL